MILSTFALFAQDIQINEEIKVSGNEWHALSRAGTASHYNGEFSRSRDSKSGIPIINKKYKEQTRSAGSMCYIKFGGTLRVIKKIDENSYEVRYSYSGDTNGTPCQSGTFLILSKFKLLNHKKNYASKKSASDKKKNLCKSLSKSLAWDLGGDIDDKSWYVRCHEGFIDVDPDYFGFSYYSKCKPYKINKSISGILLRSSRYGIIGKDYETVYLVQGQCGSENLRANSTLAIVGSAGDYLFVEYTKPPGEQYRNTGWILAVKKRDFLDSVAD